MKRLMTRTIRILVLCISWGEISTVSLLTQMSSPYKKANPINSPELDLLSHIDRQLRDESTQDQVLRIGDRNETKDAFQLAVLVFTENVSHNHSRKTLLSTLAALEDALTSPLEYNNKNYSEKSGESSVWKQNISHIIPSTSRNLTSNCGQHLRSDLPVPGGNFDPVGQNDVNSNMTQTALEILDYLQRSYGYAKKSKKRRECWYNSKKYACGFSVSCLMKGLKPIDTCKGGFIWSCCVPKKTVKLAEANVGSFSGTFVCGQPIAKSNRIIGGDTTDFGTNPWQAALVRKTIFGFVIYCGGSLISKRYVLTAAHCVARTPRLLIRVRLGEWNRKHMNERLVHKEYTISKRIVHPKYYSFIVPKNDIALLRTSKVVSFSEHVLPICLPKADQNYTGLDAFSSGWGRTSEGGKMSDELQITKLTIMSKPECKRQFEILSWFNLIYDMYICAADKNSIKNTCQGDSGGPLMVKTNNQSTLVGIVSWGRGCDPSLPGFYTNVSHYLDWIEGYTKGESIL